MKRIYPFHGDIQKENQNTIFKLNNKKLIKREKLYFEQTLPFKSYGWEILLVFQFKLSFSLFGPRRY